MPTDRRPEAALPERMPNDADRTGTPAGVFGAELRFYRTRASLSQKDLAALVHVSNDVISKIETGERPPGALSYVQTRCHRALYDGVVTPQPAEAFDQHDVIHLGGETAVVVPVDEYRKLRALERLAPPDELEAAEADAVLEAHREWVAAGRPGAVSHEEAMAELLGGSP
jgi:DNA-binding XRE family transcriptional regulator